MRALRERVRSHTVFDWAERAAAWRPAGWSRCGDRRRRFPLAPRRDRQRPRAGAGRPRYQHRLAVPAALRQPVGVRAAARSGARRHVGVRAGRGLARDRWPTCATPTCCAPRSRRPTAGSRSSTSRRGCSHGLTSTRRSKSAGCCGRSTGTPRVRVRFRSRARLRARAASRSWPPAHGLEVRRRAARACTCRTNVPAPYIAGRHADPRSIGRRSSRSAPASRPTIDSAAGGRDARSNRPSRGWRAWAKTVRAAVVRARVGAALGAVPEAARLQRHRRDHRRGDDQHPRSARLRTHLGLPLLLAARRGVRRRGAAPLEPPRRKAKRSCASCATMADSGPLQPMYGIAGKRDLHRGDPAAPARLRRHRSGAHRQRRLRAAPARRDGEMVLCLETILTDPRVVWEDPSLAPLLERLVDEAMRVVRGRRHRAVGVPHACRGTTRSRRRCAGSPRIAAPSSPSSSACPSARGDGSAWADAERARSSSTRAYNEELGFFTQALDGAVSRRVEPAAADDRPRSTRPTRVSARRCAPTRSMLAPDGLMLRYKHLDDFGHTTSAFSICSFWWVEALAMMGEVDEAVALFRSSREIRQSARAVLRRHRAGDRRAARQLPAGLHPRRPDPRRDHDRRDPRRAARLLPRLELSRCHVRCHGDTETRSTSSKCHRR